MNSQQLQRKFADYVRKGLAGNFPEVNGKAFALYHSHLKSKLSHLLGVSFVLTREAIGPLRWEQVIKNFLETCTVSGESVMNLSQAFYAHFAAKIKNSHLPYLKDLLQFEYLLIELFYMENIPYPSFHSIGNRLESPVVINPEHRLIRLDYPVFKHKGASLAALKGFYYLLLYRHPTLFTVELIELSALYFSALSRMAVQPLSLLTAMEEAAHDFDVPAENLDPDEMIDFFASLHAHRAILGFY
jgi:hypothetical protein